jgi:nicotinate-nucleotide adenylyltransferase
MPHALRLGVFGGAFDPPHQVHRAMAEAALEQLQLDCLLVLPTGQAWHKSRVLTGSAHRLAMAQLAFGDLPRVQVDARETQRHGATYTVDTLRELVTEHPQAQLFVIIGQDQADTFTRWREWGAVARLAIICVAARPDPSGAVPALQPPAGFEARFLSLKINPMRVSATDIRARARGGAGLVPLVCDRVAGYIVHHHLYQTD